MVRDILEHLTAREELSADEINAFINAIARDQLDSAQIAAVLMGLLLKGTSAPEIAALTLAMRAHCLPVRPKIRDELLDTCGTGGGLSTFNISTATAILCAAAGIPVAKHGSRSLASLSGSADVLEALGVAIDLPATALERMIEEIGIAFIHAPLFHPIMRRVLSVEASLGIKTLFYTLIGPLISPALAPRHLLGVYRRELVEPVAQVVREVGFSRAMVVHGLDGVDEISLLGPTLVHELEGGQLRVYGITPEQFGLSRCRLEDIRSRVPEANAELIRAIFAGKLSGPPRDAVLLNSAGALIVGGRAKDFREGLALAASLIDEGAVSRKLAQLVAMSQDLASTQPMVSPGPNAPAGNATRTQQLAELSAIGRIWQGLLQSTPDAIAVLDHGRLVTIANAQAALQLGCAMEDLTGRLYGISLDDEVRELRLRQLDAVLSSGRMARWEDAAGGHHFAHTAVAVGDDRLVLISRDISEQVRAEQSEQDKRARLKTLIETLPDLVWLKDSDGRFLNCNPKFERLVGAAEARIKGRREEELLPRSLASLLSADAALALREQRPVHNCAWLNYASDGHQEYVEIIHTPFIDQRGVTKGVMAIARDVTAFKYNEEELQRHRAQLELLVSERTAELSRTIDQLRATQQELLQAEKLASLGSLVAGISHELNTPIGNLVTIATTLQEEHANFCAAVSDGSIKRSHLTNHLNRSQEMLTLLDSSARRAAHLINNFKQVAADQTSEHRRHFDLHEVVAANLATLMPGFRRLPVEFLNQVPPGINCDSFPGSLGQIITNLLQNCASHAFTGRDQGRVIISATSDGLRIRLQVSDDGIGMEAATLVRIFDPFFTTKLGKGGSGLGLSICKRIASSVLGGDLTATSSPGQGTTFVLTMPHAAPGSNLGC